MKTGVISIIGLLTIGVGQVKAGTISIDTGNLILSQPTLLTPQDFSSIDLGK